MARRGKRGCLRQHLAVAALGTRDQFGDDVGAGGVEVTCVDLEGLRCRAGGRDIRRAGEQRRVLVQRVIVIDLHLSVERIRSGVDDTDRDREPGPRPVAPADAQGRADLEIISADGSDGEAGQDPGQCSEGEQAALV